jgi:hypothetical protein
MVTKNILFPSLLGYHLTAYEKSRMNLMKLMQDEITAAISLRASNPTQCMQMLKQGAVDHDQVVGECFNFLAAGSELIGGPIANEMLFLSKNKVAREKAKKEIIEKLSPNNDLLSAEECLQSLTFNVLE